MKYMKKAMALLLCVIMTLAMSVTVVSAAPTETTLKIKTTAGHTYKVYQLAKGDLDALNGGQGTLSNVEAGYSLKTDATYTTVDKVLEFLSTKTKAELSTAAGNYIDASKVFATVVGDGTTKAVEVTLQDEKLVTGYYVVVDTYTDTSKESDKWISRNMVAVAGETTMEPKVDATDIDKNIIDNKLEDNTTDDPNKALDYVEGKGGKTDTAAIGDEIQYEVTGEVPNHAEYTYYYYVLDDTLSKGLTLKDNSFVVKVGETTLTKGTDYYVYKDAADSNGNVHFQLAFENIKAYTVGTKISIKYNAEVNANAVIGTDPNTNTAKLIYSNNPNTSDRGDKDSDHPGVPGTTPATGEGPSYITKTYVTELNLTKVDQDGMPLKGAEFTLYGKNLNKVIIRTDYTFTKNAKGNYYKLKDSTYTTKAPTVNVYEEKDGQRVLKTKSNYDLYEGATFDDTENKVTVSEMYARETVVSTETTSATSENNTMKVTASVNDNGFVTFTGLNKGDYKLVETKTPAGYNTVGEIEFTIGATQTGSTATTGGTISWTSDNNKVTESAGTFYVTVENVKGQLLPSTGGIGTTIFYVVGTVLVLGAAVLLISKKRMSSEN